MAANWVEEFAATEEGGAIWPDAKAMVVGRLFVVPHPVDSIVESPHKAHRSSPNLQYLFEPYQTDSRFISIISTSVNLLVCVIDAV